MSAEQHCPSNNRVFCEDIVGSYNAVERAANTALRAAMSPENLLSADSDSELAQLGETFAEMQPHGALARAFLANCAMERPPAERCDGCALTKFELRLLGGEGE